MEMQRASPFDDRLVRSQFGHRQPVHEQQIGYERQPVHGATHRQRRGTPDVESLDLPCRRSGDDASERDFPDFLGQRFALLGRQESCCR